MIKALSLSALVIVALVACGQKEEPSAASQALDAVRR